MKNVLKVARTPALSVSKSTTVIEAIRSMLGGRVGAVAVVDEGRVIGMFTERDVMARVVLEQRDPEKTPVGDVMTAPVQTIDVSVDANDALRIMIDNHFRHLPVVDPQGKLVGMLSMRHLMREQIDHLENEVGALANYISSDGIGG